MRDDYIAPSFHHTKSIAIKTYFVHTVYIQLFNIYIIYIYYIYIYYSRVESPWNSTGDYSQGA